MTMQQVISAPNFKLGWVKPSVIENLKGITINALSHKCKQGVLTEGYHYRKAADGNIYFNFENVDEWLATSIMRAG
jgi:hypothetical protein